MLIRKGGANAHQGGPSNIRQAAEKGVGERELSARLGGLSLGLGIGDAETYFTKILLVRYFDTYLNDNLDTSDPDIHVAFPPALPPKES
jgi:hypothetical protein